MSRVYRLKFILWVLAGLAASVAVARFLYGLGSTTHLSDAVPWGFWIGFDVMAGVALAAGSFIVTATVYIFKLERFDGIVRSAVLTAFLGYMAVVAGLIFDLGLPWNIWHMIVFWNPHSPLFEVGWCVMLYLAVLALEFFPVPAEEFSALARVRRVLIRFRLPLVILGIALSTLHQSSLGSLFLIMPYRLHPLWYSPLLPLMFLVSAIALGLMMVIFESHATAFLYRRKPETELLSGLGRAAIWTLGAYVVLRFGDLAARGHLRDLWSGEWQVKMFWTEIAVMVIVPALLFALPRLRQAQWAQWSGAGIGVFGVVLDRINVGGLVHPGRGAGVYVPSWTELSVSAGVVSGAALAFLFALERFKVWEHRPADPAADPLKLPEFDTVGFIWLGTPAVAARTVYSLAFIVAASLGLALLAPSPAAGRGIEASLVHRARGGATLWIDGNLNGYGVAFPHEQIEQRLGGANSCVKCHHMNLPRDRASGCYECHRDMYTSSDAFRHAWHYSPAGGRLACWQCHEQSKPRAAATARSCASCHKNLAPAGASIQVKQYQAVGYVQAMHALCIDCHAKRAKEDGKPDLARCADCHKDRRELTDAPDLALRPSEFIGRGMLLPAVSGSR